MKSWHSEKPNSTLSLINLVGFGNKSQLKKLTTLKMRWYVITYIFRRVCAER
jgi:hypothetical protein